LESIKQATAGGTELSLDDVNGLDRTEYSGWTLVETVGAVKRRIESD